jgi:hypothetical protein
MSPTYAMVWSVGGGPRTAGRIDLNGHSLGFESATGLELVRYDDITRVALDRGVLEVQRADARPPLLIASMDSPGALRELCERITAAAHLPG